MSDHEHKSISPQRANIFFSFRHIFVNKPQALVHKKTKADVIYTFYIDLLVRTVITFGWHEHFYVVIGLNNTLLSALALRNLGVNFSVIFSKSSDLSGVWRSLLTDSGGRDHGMYSTTRTSGHVEGSSGRYGSSPQYGSYGQYDTSSRYSSSGGQYGQLSSSARYNSSALGTHDRYGGGGSSYGSRLDNDRDLNYNRPDSGSSYTRESPYNKDYTSRASARDSLYGSTSTMYSSTKDRRGSTLSSNRDIRDNDRYKNKDSGDMAQRTEIYQVIIVKIWRKVQRIMILTRKMVQATEGIFMVTGERNLAQRTSHTCLQDEIVITSRTMIQKRKEEMVKERRKNERIRLLVTWVEPDMKSVSSICFQDLRNDVDIFVTWMHQNLPTRTRIQLLSFSFSRL